MFIQNKLNLCRARYVGVLYTVQCIFLLTTQLQCYTSRIVSSVDALLNFSIDDHF